MLRRTFALAAELAGQAAPTEIRLFRAGVNKTTKGDFLFDRKAADAVMKAFKEYGNDLCFDYAHSVVPEVGAKPQDQKAAGWFQLDVREGELWAVDIRWTDAAKAEVEKKEWRYCSPYFAFDEKSTRILEIINVALTNTPATLDAMPLVAADRRTQALAGFKATEQALTKALEARFLPDDATTIWIAEIFDSTVVFRLADQLFQMGYSMQAGAAVLDGDPVRVEVTYTPVTAAVGRTQVRSVIVNLQGAGPTRRELLGSFQDTISAITEALKARYPTEEFGPWPDAVFESTFIYRKGKLWQQAYHLDGSAVVLDGEPTEVEQIYVPVAPAPGSNSASRARADTQTGAADSAKETVMRNALIVALGLKPETAESEVLGAVAKLHDAQREVMTLTGKPSMAEALGVIAAWKQAAEQLPGVQKSLREREDLARKSEVDKILDGATTKVTPAMRPSLLAARGFDCDEDVAWLRAHVEALPTLPGHAALGAGNTDQQVATGPAAGKKWEELTIMERHNLFHADHNTYDALKADHARRNGN